MIWVKEYDWIEDALKKVRAEYKGNLERAWADAQARYKNNKSDDFVVITIGNYFCVAAVDEYDGYVNIYELVFPFDKKEVFPMQKVVLNYDFIW